MKHDCNNQPDCMKMLHLILDGEASSEQKEHFFKHHLEICMPCYQTYNLEMLIRQLLKQNCFSKTAPSELVKSIKNSINSIS